MSELTSLVDEIVAGLRQWSFNDLNVLPAHKDESSKGYSLATWKEALGPDVVRIVVQGYKGGRFGVGKMYARGFRMTQTGQIQELQEAELLEFS
jgi:hypothetical protein